MSMFGEVSHSFGTTKEDEGCPAIKTCVSFSTISDKAESSSIFWLKYKVLMYWYLS